MKNPNIILVGFMGTGKSAAGRRVAECLEQPFLDMDDEIERRTGRKISDIFTKDGEAVFRRIERDLVRELAGREDLVVAAGGGVVLNPDNIRDFSRTGMVICLSAPPEVILRRVEQENHRPLLEDGDRARKIRDLLAARKPLYDAIPNRIDTAHLTLEDVVDRIVKMVQRPAPPEGR